MKTIPFVGGRLDGHYLSVPNAHRVPIVGIRTNGVIDHADSIEQLGKGPYPQSIYRKHIALHSISGENKDAGIVYVYQTMTKSQAVRRLLTNYSPETK